MKWMANNIYLKKDKDAKELIKELEDLSERVILEPSRSLTEVARNHAIDMGETGRTGHNASDGHHAPADELDTELYQKFWVGPVRL